MACSGPRLAPPLMPSVRFHELLRRDIWRIGPSPCGSLMQINPAQTATIIL